ncbi:hypothetical protein [Bradyrhizobium genosp. P]|uniref:hypothetical protein n=1 Tax=Bradyrhizobium genosp. P TaxID=83641 RepID=UPI003CFB550A
MDRFFLALLVSAILLLAVAALLSVDVEVRGRAKNVYETIEAAFGAAVTAASLALRQGHEVRITAPEHAMATGAANAG